MLENANSADQAVENSLKDRWREYAERLLTKCEERIDEEMKTINRRIDWANDMLKQIKDETISSEDLKKVAKIAHGTHDNLIPTLGSNIETLRDCQGMTNVHLPDLKDRVTAALGFKNSFESLAARYKNLLGSLRTKTKDLGS